MSIASASPADVEVKLPVLSVKQSWTMAATEWLHTVCVGVWIGGFVAIGAIVAPMVVRAVHAAPEVAGNSAFEKEMLAGIVGGSLQVFNGVCCVCLVLMSIANIVQMSLLAPKPIPKKANRVVRATLYRWMAMWLLALTVLCLIFLFQLAETARMSGNMAQFDMIHRFYVTVSVAQLPILLIIAALSAVRDWVYRNDRSVPA